MQTELHEGLLCSDANTITYFTLIVKIKSLLTQYSWLTLAIFPS